MAELIADSDPAILARLCAVLSAGGVVIMPCDTIYGIVGPAPEAEARIRSIKGRSETKPFIQLIAHEGWLSRLTARPLPPSLRPYWPGPLTIVFPAPAGGTVAVRYPGDPLTLGVLGSLNRPVYSTSVNRSGGQPLGRIQEIVAQFGADVDVVVEAGDRPAGAPSTVLDVTTVPFRVLRQGVLYIPPEALR